MRDWFQPAVVPRSEWGADEALRFGSNGAEITPPSFWAVQKLFIHHTATRNGDEHPAETLRSIQRFHAIDRGFGDIAYNLLIDEDGRIYEGRYSPFSSTGEAPPGHDPRGRAVAATHALGYNAGTISVALLGNYVDREPSPAAVAALTRAVAWLAFAHGLDPQGAGLFVNPLSGESTNCANVAGHGEIMATLCPGERLAARLPELRAKAAALIARPARRGS